MLKRWIHKWLLWLKGLEGIDDPEGEYLLRLEERVCRLEEEVGALHARSR